MTMDPFNGHIKVWVGGVDFDHFKYDHVNQAKRQAGSTFKPFAYLAALESGMSPCDKFIDRPVRIAYDENNTRNDFKACYGPFGELSNCSGYRSSGLG